ncbi:hypothetical protein L2E82_29245 [Cichorium intybus]|uniref:Uncharacterized protein n=1 Tax=Cichorium intybus TaxID=13427 RepID=A0ACB9CXB1_CICIN|nr:hypothetical protein L2E82_29245 [Cichorium intybus]
MSPICFIDLEWDDRRSRLLCSLQIGHSGFQEATYFYPNDFHPPHTSTGADHLLYINNCQDLEKKRGRKLHKHSTRETEVLIREF